MYEKRNAKKREKPDVVMYLEGREQRGSHCNCIRIDRMERLYVSFGMPAERSEGVGR